MFGDVVYDWVIENGVLITDLKKSSLSFIPFYNSDRSDRENWADPTAQELDIAIDNSKLLLPHILCAQKATNATNTVKLLIFAE